MQFAPVIAAVLQDSQGLPRAEVRRRLRKAYPLVPRSHWPYRAWLDEIAAQWPEGRQDRGLALLDPEPQGSLFEADDAA